jgi:hypothetical protein
VIAAHQNKNRQFPTSIPSMLSALPTTAQLDGKKVQRAISAAGLQPVAP